ncbi:MFS transporter [Arthrobacter sp. GCM10027362]|uniref:MFS transporter n=1 Tax=Arthrobacter sp. GCM10027362 TaxID=3273379 RepID=UPI00363D192A
MKLRRLHSSLIHQLTTPLGTVVIEGFGSRLAFGIVSFALPLYAVSLGMSLASVGLLLSTNTAVSIALKPLIGPLVDRMGVRRAYVIAVALRTASMLLLVVSFQPWQLFAVRGLHGVSIALRDPAAAAVLAGLGGKRAVARRFAWYQTAKTVAGSAGRFAAGVLITLLIGNYAWVFVVSAAISTLPLALILWRLRGPALAGLRRPPAVHAAAREAWRRMGSYAGLGFLASGTANFMSNLLPVFAVEYAGLPAAAAGGIYLVTAVIALSGPVWGWLADRGNTHLVLGMRAVGNIFSSAIWLLSPTYAGLIAGKTADDLGKAAFRPAWGAMMADAAERDPRRRAATLSRLSAAEDLGEATGPIAAGMIWTAWGIPAVLGARIVLAVVTEVYTIFLHRAVSAPAGSAEGAGIRLQSGEPR